MALSRVVWQRWVAAVHLCLSACAAQADTAAIAQRTEAAWRAWMETADVTRGGLALTYRGAVVHEAVLDASPGQAFDLASLSKAVTGLCIRALVDEGVLGYDDLVGETLRPGQGALSGVTVAQLLTHAGGIWPDSTQGPMEDWRGEIPSRTDYVTNTVLNRTDQTGDVGTFTYNNENYAVLAEVIEAVVQQPYREACRDRVLEPLGAPVAEPSPKTGSFDAWGGWAMPLADYARLHARGFAGTDPFATPHVDMGGGAHYGLGTVFRSFGEGHNFWHFGLLCFTDEGFGSYAVLFANGWGAVVAHNRCLGAQDAFALDGALVRGVFGP